MELIDKKRLKEYLEDYKTCFTWNDGGRELALLKRISAHVEKTPIKAVSCGICEYYDPVKSQCTHRLGLRGYLNKYVDFCSMGRWNPHE